MEKTQVATSGANFLDNAAAAAFLGVTPHTLEVWRNTGRYKIPHVKVGRLVRYRPRDLDAWLESRLVDATDDTRLAA